MSPTVTQEETQALREGMDRSPLFEMVSGIVAAHAQLARRPVYVWGSMSNTEPPEDDDDIEGYYGAPGVVRGEDEGA